MSRSERKGCRSPALTALCALVAMFMVVASVGACTSRVNTRFGHIQGLLSRSTRGRLVSQYLGVPYALPPVADLRFRNPQSWNRTWVGNFEAIENGPACLQWNNDQLVGSEDCLYLNIYVPLNCERNAENEETNISLPVMVYIHGGMFTRGSSDSRKLPPDYMMDQNIVLVTVNYRLNVLGFLSTGTQASSGNYGLKDVVEALRWVQDNIRSFHGDPDNVTLWGHSSGAIVSHLLAMSNRTEGLFNRYIVQGGNAFSVSAMMTNRAARSVALETARKLNCLPLKMEPAKADNTEENETEGGATGKSSDNEDEIQKKNETQAEENADSNTGAKEIQGGESVTVQPDLDYEDQYTAEEEEDMMWCLRHVDARDLARAIKSFRLSNDDTCCVFAPVIEDESNDGALVTMHPVKAAKERRFRDLPFIIGATEHEGLGKIVDILAGDDTLVHWLMSDFENNLPYMLYYLQLSFNTTTFAKAIEDFYFSGNVSYSNVKENITMLQTDAMFIWPAYRTAKYLSEFVNSSIYFYFFTYEGTFSYTFKYGSTQHYGVTHVDDLNYLIPIANKKFESFMLHNTESDITMINIMTEMWASFAATGVPEAWTIPAWPDWHESNEFLRFGNGKQPEVTVQGDFFPERMSFWEELSKSIDFEIMEGQCLMDASTESSPNDSDVRTHNKVLLCILATLIIHFL